MTGEWTISWVWWISAVEVPLFGCLFWLMHHGRREAERALLKVYSEIQGNLNMVLENLAQSKLEIARLYATVADLRDVEKRLTDHLLRLESRLTYSRAPLDGDLHWSCRPRRGPDAVRSREDRGHAR